ncbi:MAG: rod shape-determining protein MreC [Alcanivoracaceae bacterium]|uniref:rod shape-determining protein MreC n=1 Tax=Alcanivorax sp. MD8A TaxID=1177157 RepID=UPI000C48DD79|nr:rod shape-determining protein MreC [Alcanivorax sp. MD8A]MAX55251.1 rod shape-determining protein MreC [Alcanivoracaceae bacterium]MCG8436954.1 rod shape-determining protein MreC [Pseudomonadales bacterium]MED5431825.1 rod shape-determining protein MreC [Pseudomonadota bacterium]MEE2868920.1 rod shape-determining protein MreC [Pseudomonadota bacterium]PNE03141.1 rod shape determining protein MreC [Alcanivorax sp. MD8A]|tara:strand:+ start:2107 stop:2955 length:849 start_codon:yes stop_codon:yes gene_type:complete
MTASANPLYRLVAALVLSVIVIVLDQRTPWAEPVRHVLAYLTAPIHYVAHLPVDSGQWLTEQAQSRSSLMEENQRLQRQSLILEQKVQRLAVLEAENVRLRELLNSSADLDANVLVAEIIGVDPDPNRQELVINKGTGSDVFRGQAVLDAQGLIGQVVDAGPLSSRVLLLTDASHAMSVQVNRNGVRAVLAGNGQTGLRLLYVPDTADIEEGDLLVSTGLGQRYPRGYPVGTVTSVRHQSGAPYADITALPTARIDRASHVLLVQPTQTPASPLTRGDADAR